MKYITFPSLVFAAGLAASSLLAPSLLAADSNAGHAVEELLALEGHKTDYVFGTPAEKQLAIAMYAPDYQGIGYTPFGPARQDYSMILAIPLIFPTVPAGTFTQSDWHVQQVGPNTYVVSYLQVGPGPTGEIQALYQSSTWTWRSGHWKTVFFQQTLVPVPSF